MARYENWQKAMRAFIQKHWIALACATAAVAWEWTYHIGMQLVEIVPVYVIWLVYATIATLISRRRDLLKTRATNAGIWLLAIVIMIGSLPVLKLLARQDADRALVSIKHYATTNGRYPKTLADVGIDAKYADRQCGLKYSQMLGGPTPTLMYRDAFDPFDKYFYDFEKQAWEFHPD